LRRCEPVAVAGTEPTRLSWDIASRRGLPMERKRYYSSVMIVNGSRWLLGRQLWKRFWLQHLGAELRHLPAARLVPGADP